MRFPRIRGFSLIELIVTLAVLAIMAGVAIPSFLDYIDRARVKGAADEVVALVATARTEAIKRGRNITVSGASGTTWCVGANEAATPAALAPYATSAACNCSSGTCTVDGNSRIVSASTTNGVTAGSVFTNFTLDARQGSLTNPAATPSMTMSSPQGTYQIQLDVTALGLVRACTPASQPQIPGYAQCA